MKVRKLKINHFKRFTQPLELDFTNHETGTTHEIVALIGNNGCGKTSVLQAIAAVLGTACGRLEGPQHLDWPGFDVDLADRNYKTPAELQVLVEFSPSERDATLSLFKQLQMEKSDLTTVPGDYQEITLTCNGLKNVKASEGPRGWFQFRGRAYASQLVRSLGHDPFKEVGSIFWYTDHRNAMSLTHSDPDKTLIFSLDRLRDLLSKWQLRTLLQKHQNGRDIMSSLQDVYGKVFPNRRFVGPLEKGHVDRILDEPWFMLSDGIQEYELSEMSGAERAIFPILLDFVNWDINHSVILIDELELHCHPPIQQMLLWALQRLGRSNQIILTTHSDHIVDLLPESAVFRLD